MAATGNNGQGITGVAWALQLLSCKIYNATGGGTKAAIMACLDYCM